MTDTYLPRALAWLRTLPICEERIEIERAVEGVLKRRSLNRVCVERHRAKHGRVLKTSSGTSYKKARAK